MMKSNEIDKDNEYEHDPDHVHMKNNMKNNMISTLSEYMLTLKNISKVDMCMTDEPIKQTTSIMKKNITTVVDIFFPRQRDMLFWSFYIFLNDTNCYDMTSNYFTTEKECKYKWIEEFRCRKELFKPIKVSRNAVEDELANANTISMITIKALCHLKNVNVFYIDSKKYYEIIVNEDSPIHVIEKIDGKYGIKQKTNIDKIEYYRNHYWKMENLDKPLKAISSYKSEQLKDICKRLNIDIHQGMTKPQMYEKILEKL